MARAYPRMPASRSAGARGIAGCARGYRGTMRAGLRHTHGMAEQHTHHAHHDHAAHDHDHGHAHGHDHASHAHHHHAPASFDRAFAIGITVNILFVAIEAFYGWKVNS